MIGQVSFLLALASTAVCQQTSFAPTTGTRSLWIPFQTVSGTPLASIPVVDPTATGTIYILSCPTDEPNCPLSPRLTLTEGPTSIRYMTRNAAGYAVLHCDASGTTSAVCSQYGSANGHLFRDRQSTVYEDKINYQAVSVTSINSVTTSGVKTTTVGSDTTTATMTVTTTETSSGGAVGPTGGVWYFGCAVGPVWVAAAAL